MSSARRAFRVRARADRRILMRLLRQRVRRIGDPAPRTSLLCWGSSRGDIGPPRAAPVVDAEQGTDPGGDRRVRRATRHTDDAMDPDRHPRCRCPACGAWDVGAEGCGQAPLRARSTGPPVPSRTQPCTDAGHVSGRDDQRERRRPSPSSTTTRDAPRHRASTPRTTSTTVEASDALATHLPSASTPAKTPIMTTAGPPAPHPGPSPPPCRRTP